VLVAEVQEARRMADRQELTKLKEQLLISFKDQMELRKSLMELNNASMEISLETNRNQIIITEYVTATWPRGFSEVCVQNIVNIFWSFGMMFGFKNRFPLMLMATSMMWRLFYH